MWKLKLGRAKNVSRLLLITNICFFSLPVPLYVSALIDRNGGGGGCVCVLSVVWLFYFVILF